MSKRKIPKWMYRHTQKCREAFGIGGDHERLYLHRVDVIASNADAAAETKTTPRYLCAELTFRRDVHADANGYEDVTHEVLHAAMPLQCQAVTRIIDLLPMELQGHAWALWQDANEATVTRLARGLAPLLRSKKHD